MTLDESRIQTEVVLKLFDTLRDSNGHLKATIDKQTEAIVHLSHLMREGTKPAEVKALLEKHNESAGAQLNDIDTCTDTINDKSDTILNVLQSVSKKINNTLIVICVAFSLLIISYYYVRSHVDVLVDKKIKANIEQIVKIPAENKQLINEIEKLRKEIEELKREDGHANSKTETNGR